MEQAQFRIYLNSIVTSLDDLIESADPKQLQEIQLKALDISRSTARIKQRRMAEEKQVVSRPVVKI